MHPWRKALLQVADGASRGKHRLIKPGQRLRLH
jgi:hypothetical protein